MVFTNDKALADRIRHLSTQARSDTMEYDHDEIGFNYRLTNIQAAMGLAQMEQLDEFVAAKRDHVGMYHNLLSNIEGVGILPERTWAKSNFWYITAQVPAKHRNSLMEFMNSRGVNVRPVWKPLHTLQIFSSSQAYDITNAVEAYNTSINLPSSVNLTEEEIEYVAENIAVYFKNHECK